jgi:arsenate reductase
MGEIATSNRQITLYFNTKSVRAKQTLAYAKAEGWAIQEIDIIRTTLTGTQIVELAEGLHLKLADLVNQEHPTYTSKFEHHNFSTNDWIKMMQKHPEIIKQPIALRGNRTILIETPTDIINI